MLDSVHKIVEYAKNRCQIAFETEGSLHKRTSAYAET